jgi:hypothetical protein
MPIKPSILICQLCNKEFQMKYHLENAVCPDCRAGPKSDSNHTCFNCRYEFKMLYELVKGLNLCFRCYEHYLYDPDIQKEVRFHNQIKLNLLKL